MSDDTGQPSKDRFERRLSQLLDLTLGVVLAALIFAMMVLTFIDVVGRQGFNAPVPAGFEVTALMMGFTVYLGFPIVSARQEHISIGLLDHLFKGRRRRIQQFVIHLLGGVLSLIWAREVWIQGNALAEANELLMFLQIRTASFVYAMAALTLTGAVVFLILAVRSLVGPAPPARGHDEV